MFPVAFLRPVIDFSRPMLSYSAIQKENFLPIPLMYIRHAEGLRGSRVDAKINLPLIRAAAWSKRIP